VRIPEAACRALIRSRYDDGGYSGWTALCLLGNLQLAEASWTPLMAPLGR